jgi:photosystem II stability/assembly factor-like uncharacterized protein
VSVVLAGVLALAPLAGRGAPSRAAAAEGEWVFMMHRDTTRLTAVTSLYGRFWAVGEAGAIMTSADAKIWTRLKPFTDRTLSGVSFPDPDSGCVVGELGLVAVTGDGGGSWTVLKPPVTEDLRAVSFGNRNVGVAVGLRGTLLVTYDGGRSWLRKDTGVAESLFAVTMPSPHEAWAVGERGMILHSTDALRTWRAERHPSQAWLYGVWFSGETGWAVGRAGAVLRRMLGAWEVIPLPAGAETLYAVAGASGSEVIAVGAKGQIWTTTDAGLSWTRRDAGTAEDIRGIAQASKTVWAVGPDNLLLSSIDAGAAWAHYSLEVLPSYLAVSFADSQNGWVVGRAGLISSTRDGGRTWGQQDAGTRKDLNAVVALSRHVCYAAGEGVIVKTIDGGLSWRRVWTEPPMTAEEYEKPRHLRRPPVSLHGLYFFDERRGWAVGTEGTVLYTSSEGARWEMLPSGVRQTLYAVWFNTPSRGFAAGQDGLVYVTSDGGRSWRGLSVGGGGEPLRAIHFLVGGRHGWMVGDGGTLLATADGGETWRETRLGGALSLRAVAFEDPLRGWIAGERGTLLRTWDGGQTWVSDRPPLAAEFYGLHWSPAAGVWAVGDRGVVLRRRGSQ